MTKQPEDWLDDVPGDDIEDEDDEIIWVSKSEIKRDAEELKRLGAELVDLGKNALDKIPLDADLRAAIELAQRIKMEGRRRQLQLIGKMLRQRDVDPIRQALDKLKNRHNQQVVVFHKLEQLRDRMVDGSDEAIEEVMNLWPDADRQQLRSLVRNARKEKAGNKPPKSSRQIFQYLRELAETRRNSAKDAPSLGAPPLQRHHMMAQILIKALVAFCIYCVRIAQHNQFMVSNPLMIRRMRMRPFIRTKPHRLIKA